MEFIYIYIYSCDLYIHKYILYRICFCITHLIIIYAETSIFYINAKKGIPTSTHTHIQLKS